MTTMAFARLALTIGHFAVGGPKMGNRLYHPHELVVSLSDVGLLRGQGTLCR